VPISRTYHDKLSRELVQGWSGLHVCLAFLHAPRSVLLQRSLPAEPEKGRVSTPSDAFKLAGELNAKLLDDGIGDTLGSLTAPTS
jgi:hypothetical protein